MAWWFCALCKRWEPTVGRFGKVHANMWGTEPCSPFAQINISKRISSNVEGWSMHMRCAWIQPIFLEFETLLNLRWHLNCAITYIVSPGWEIWSQDFGNVQRHCTHYSKRPKNPRGDVQINKKRSIVCRSWVGVPSTQMLSRDSSSIFKCRKDLT